MISCTLLQAIHARLTVSIQQWPTMKENNFIMPELLITSIRTCCHSYLHYLPITKIRNKFQYVNQRVHTVLCEQQTLIFQSGRPYRLTFTQR